MKSILNYAILAILTVISISTVSAQKFAHINSQLLMVELPEMKAADAEVKTYQEGLMKKGQEMVQAFEAKYLAYAEKANQGELNKIQMQQMEGDILPQRRSRSECLFFLLKSVVNNFDIRSEDLCLKVVLFPGGVFFFWDIQKYEHYVFPAFELIKWFLVYTRRQNGHGQF